MLPKINYYRLTINELSFVSSIQDPVICPSSNDEHSSRPVVVAILKSTGFVSRVYTLSWFKRMVKDGTINSHLYSYHIYSML